MKHPILYCAGLILAFGSIIYSCNSEKPDVLLQKMIGREVLFSSSYVLATQQNIQDTLFKMLLSPQPKIINYVVESNCNACQMHLSEWNVRIKELDRWYKKTPVVFVIAANPTEAEAAVRQYHCPAWVLSEQDHGFREINKLPVNPVFHTFLLNRDNRVVLVGSPIGNPRMWELYKSTIAKLVENDGTLPDAGGVEKKRSMN